MPEKKNREDEKVMAAIAYIWVLFLVPLLTRKDSDFCQFHAKQGFVLFIAITLVTVASWIPVIGWLVAFFGAIVTFVLFIIGMLNALNGKKEKLPIIGEYADSFNL